MSPLRFSQFRDYTDLKTLKFDMLLMPKCYTSLGGAKNPKNPHGITLNVHWCTAVMHDFQQANSEIVICDTQ
jgi:hypothetical protein